MLFNSQYFIFVFLPLVLIGWYILNHFNLHKVSLVFLSGMSLWFYGYFNPRYLIIIISSILVNYLFSFILEKTTKFKKPVFIASLVFNILLLGYYKYYDFFVENINAVFKTSFVLKHILLPLGISFFTLQQISYLIDRYWGTAPHYNFIYYFTFVTFFPQLIAGPIVTHSEMIPQFMDTEKRRFNKTSFRDGVILFILGLSKKVLIADILALPVNYGFDKPVNLDTISAWIVALCFLFELYFDFSGYCDMACGLGKMFNFELPANFDSPLKSKSIPEYWVRWHSTLGRFFTTYIYTPLTIIGMRKGKKKLYSIITPLIVFLISGFWHGASWTFIIWGLTQGIATVWCHRKKFKVKNPYIKWAATFIYTVLCQAIFRSENIPTMVSFFKVLFTFQNRTIIYDIGSTLTKEPIFQFLLERMLNLKWPHLYIAYFCILVVFIIIAALLCHGKNSHEILKHYSENGITVGFAIVISVALTLSIISLTQVTTFLYFNF